LEKIVYAKTNKKINRLGFGAWQLNNPLWGAMSEAEGIALVKEAMNLGVNFFDTAPGYGSGMSEIILGKAIQGYRESVVINTKLGHTAEGKTDFSVESLDKQIKDSLERMHIKYLDSVILHNPNRDILEGKTTHFQVLNQIKKKGLIRAYGVSIDTYDELLTVLNNNDVDVVEILFNVFFQGPSKAFEMVKEKGVSLIAKVPLDSGWLTGKYNEQSTFTGIRNRWTIEVIHRRGTLVKQLKAITNSDVLTPYALGFILSFPEITAVIPGIKTIEQLHAYLDSDFEISDEIKKQMIELYKTEIERDPLPW
jgi:aryl-alcohol dehydrogenase-like predicted oxidoreductase